MRKRFTIIKGATKSVLDYCLLPGTAIGAEILWIYSMQWKNRVWFLALAIMSMAMFNESRAGEMHPEGNLNAQENTR